MKSLSALSAFGDFHGKIYCFLFVGIGEENNLATIFFLKIMLVHLSIELGFRFLIIGKQFKAMYNMGHLTGFLSYPDSFSTTYVHTKSYRVNKLMGN